MFAGAGASRSLVRASRGTYIIHACMHTYIKIVYDHDAGEAEHGFAVREQRQLDQVSATREEYCEKEFYILDHFSSKKVHNCQDRKDNPSVESIPRIYAYNYIIFLGK